MPQQEPWQITAQNNMQMQLIGHGALVILVSLFAAFMLTFDMLNGLKIWPFMDIELDIIGSVRGWKTAHVGGLLNGVMVIAFALCINKIHISPSSLKFSYHAFILTAWGNTIFYWAANFSTNRGLSVNSTPYGEASIYGTIAYISGASVMLLTVIATIIIAKGAFNAAQDYTN